MNPLTITWPPALYTDYGHKNFINWINKGGFDNITYRPNGDVFRKLTKLAIEESRVKASEGQNALRLLNELVRDEEKDKTKREIASAKLMTDAMKLDEQMIKGGKDGTK